jgi:AcrR family transcriptional regulator
MVINIQQTGHSEKLGSIMKAAQKRLALYGFEKTTMSEIAADVHLSKASLYYYFPDKESLLRAVLYKEQDEYFTLISSRMNEVRDPENMIQEFIRIRHEYFTTFLNLTKFRFSDFYQIKPHFQELIDSLRSTEVSLFTEILKKGIMEGIFQVEDPDKTARLFLEIIHSLRLVVIRNRPIQDLTGEDYGLMYEKHCGFIELFLRSIKKQHIDNI